jgi:hypothetical protein
MLNTKLFEEEMEKINFSIDIQDIEGIPTEMGRKLVRTDTDTPLGIIKSKYKPILHKQAFQGALQEMKNGGLTLENAEVTIDSYENGAMAKMEVLLPEKTTLIGDHYLSLKYVARNSYNGRWKFQSFFGWLNHVCFNTLVTGQKLAYTSNRHTKSFDIDQSNKKIVNAVKAVTDETERFKNWWDTSVEDEQVKDLFEKTIAKQNLSKGSRIAGVSETNQKQLAILMGLYNEEVTQIHGKGDYGRNGAKGSLWCAYQSATAWSTHLTDINRNDTKKYLVQVDRQKLVSEMVETNNWKELENA